METSKTNPVPPTGVTPTEVPLGITARTAIGDFPADIVVEHKSALETDLDIFYGSFPISATDNTGQNVFKHTTLWPLGDFANRYNTVSGADSTLRFFVPWCLVLSFFSKMCKIDWIMRLLPVKVADCRVSLDILFNYDQTPDGNRVYSTKLMASDSIYKILDSEDDDLTFQIPMFWLTKALQTDVIGSSVGPVMPAFQPITETRIYIRNKYVPNLMQPNTFNVLVYLTPIVRNITTLAGKSALNLDVVTPDRRQPRPYFLLRNAP